ncbi:MAG: polyprenyl synthetase family protein [Acidobacteriota bacterium]
MTALDAYFAARRREVDAALEAWLPAPPACPPAVADAMRYSLLAGGKRLRPVLTLASAEAVAARDRRPADEARRLALPAACAIEMIHTYSLIHDDLPAMDNDTLRRGRPTLHVVVGEGMAILAGDALHTEAFHLLAREPRSEDAAVLARRLRVLEVVAAAAGASGMAGGQAIDLDAVAPRPGLAAVVPLDAAGLEAMHARKTGALIRASVVAGGIMAGADEPTIDALGRYASEIGLAFQIVDDILDVEGDAAALGKTAGKDAAAGKPTYPSLYGLARSRELAAACIARAEAALDAAGLAGGPLAALAPWVTARTR